MEENELIANWLRTLARLARATAHEVRGASGAMAIHAELLAGTIGATEERELHDRQRRYIGVLEEERHRLQHAIETYLTQVTVPDRHRASFDLAALATEVVALARPYADECGGSLRLERPPGPVPANARPDVVRGALVDVLLGTLDAAAPVRRVLVSVGLTGTRARVSVGGLQGVGLPVETLLSVWRRMTESAGGCLSTTEEGEVGPCLVLEFPDRADEGSERHA